MVVVGLCCCGFKEGGGLGNDAWGRERNDINNLEKKKGKEKRKRITDLLSRVCELEWAEIEL